MDYNFNIILVGYVYIVYIENWEIFCWILTGILQYQLSAVDEEGDNVIFSLLNQTQRGEVSLSSDGLYVLFI